MDNIIKELKLQLGEKEVSLTIDEAKKLKEALDELFGKEVVREVHHDHWNWNWPWLIHNLPQQEAPWKYTIYGAGSPPPLSDTQVWCTNNGATAQYDRNTSAMTLKVA